jgi:solute carrier family 13 (sodium-dependent dicarboxylate transporter), member 2/3/5
MQEKASIFSSDVVIIARKGLRRGLIERLPYPLALIGLALGFVGLLLVPTPAGLSLAGHRAIVIFGGCLFLWLWGRIPLVVTSLLAMVLLPLLGVMKASRAYALFGNEAVFFILGAFILAAALTTSGLSSRIALAILERTGSSPRRLLRTIFLLNAGMSFFMSEHAVAAMNFPIVLEVIKAMKLPRKRSNYAAVLMLALAWGSSIGGIATFLGGARAPLAVGMLKEMTGQSITFFEWVVAALPITVVLLISGLVLLENYFPIDVGSIKQARLVLRAKNNQLGAIRYEEIIVGSVMLATIVGWVSLGEQFGLASIALIGVVGLFMLRAVRWREIEAEVNWGIVLMYGGAICLGTALAETGAAKWLADVTLAPWLANPTLTIVIMSVAAYVLTEVMSNSAVVAALLPVAIPLAVAGQIDPKVIVYVIAIPAGLGFALPMGTPANAIAYSSGYVERRDMLIPGLLFGLLAIVIFNIIAIFIWPWLGIGR